MSFSAPLEISSVQAFKDAASEQSWPILCDERCAFSHPLLVDLLALWRTAAANGIPARTALTARQLRPFMRNLAIYERVGDGEQRRYRVRLLGSGIVQYYGELTGKFVDEVVPEKFLSRWYALSDVTLAVQQPLRLLLRADTFDKSYMVAEYLCCPLKAEDGAVKFVLLGMVFDGAKPWNVVAAEARKSL